MNASINMSTEMINDEVLFAIDKLSLIKGTATSNVVKIDRQSAGSRTSGQHRHISVTLL